MTWFSYFRQCRADQHDTCPGDVDTFDARGNDAGMLLCTLQLPHRAEWARPMKWRRIAHDAGVVVLVVALSAGRDWPPLIPGLIVMVAAFPIFLAPSWQKGRASEHRAR